MQLIIIDKIFLQQEQLKSIKYKGEYIMIWNRFIKKKLRKELQDCNYEIAKAMLIKSFSGSVIPNELSLLLSKFVENPGFETAFDLIKFDSRFIALFKLARS